MGRRPRASHVFEPADRRGEGTRAPRRREHVRQERLHTTLLGEKVPAVYVKASGHDLAAIEPEGHTGLDLDALRRLRILRTLDDDAMAGELLARRFDPRAAAPSIEALLHVFTRAKFVDHTHADAILALTNQPGGEARVREALGERVVLDYVKPGFPACQSRGGCIRPSRRDARASCLPNTAS